VRVHLRGTRWGGGGRGCGGEATRGYDGNGTRSHGTCDWHGTHVMEQRH
jgi:hypothetical protein